MHRLLCQEMASLHDSIFYEIMYSQDLQQRRIKMNMEMISIHALNIGTITRNSIGISSESRRSRVFIFMVLLIIDNIPVAEYSFRPVHLECRVSTPNYPLQAVENASRYHAFFSASFHEREIFFHENNHFRDLFRNHVY